MHTFPLHRAVQADCHCCRIPTEFVFKSRSDHVICGGCLRHQRAMEPIIESMTKWENDQIQLADQGCRSPWRGTRRMPWVSQSWPRMRERLRGSSGVPQGVPKM
jgi:hypothetical protein